MKARLFLAILGFAIVAAGCSGGEVKTSDLDGYKNAGLKPGEAAKQVDEQAER